MIIISGPSGAGEDSIINELEKRMHIERVRTTTTRPMRSGESQGNPYYFISEEEFKNKIQNDEFFEYARHYNDNYYGVTNEEIQRARDAGKIGIWKIDYKGTKTAKKKMPAIKAIFINAPLEALKDRIKRRHFTREDYLRQRMSYTDEWLKHKDIYDYEVVNEEGKLEQAVDQVEAIIKKIVNT